MALRAKWDKRLSETGLGLLVTAEQVQSRLASSRCTDPLLPFFILTYQEDDPEQHGKAGWFWWRWWESLALLSVGQPTQNWHWLALAVPRSALQERSPTPAMEASYWQKGTTSQHRHSVFTIGRT